MAIQLLRLSLSCFCLWLLSLLRSPLRLKSNSCPHINFDQSNALICRAGGDRDRSTQAWRWKRPGVLCPTQSLQNLYNLYFSPMAFTEMLNITMKLRYLLHWLMAPSSSGRCGRETFVIIAVAGISVYICFLSNHGMRYKTRCPFYFRVWCV